PPAEEAVGDDCEEEDAAEERLLVVRRDPPDRLVVGDHADDPGPEQRALDPADATRADGQPADQRCRDRLELETGRVAAADDAELADLEQPGGACERSAAPE